MEGSWPPVQTTAKDDVIEREALMFLSDHQREGEDGDEQTNGRILPSYRSSRRSRRGYNRAEDAPGIA
jgi:hypothetical protein